MLHYITPCKLDVEWSEAATLSRRTSQTTSPLPVRATERVPPTGPGRPRRPVRAVLIRRSGRTTPSLQADLSREPAPLAGNPPDERRAARTRRLLEFTVKHSSVRDAVPRDNH